MGLVDRCPRNPLITSTEDEQPVKASNPNIPNSPTKKMCCIDQPLTAVPGPQLKAVKLGPGRYLGKKDTAQNRRPLKPANPRARQKTSWMSRPGKS